MSFAEIKEQIGGLSRVDRRVLVDHLLELEEEEDKDYGKRMAAKIDDKNPDNWISLEELERRLDGLDEQEGQK